MELDTAPCRWGAIERRSEIRLAESEAHKPAVLELHQAKKERADLTWRAALEARNDLDAFERELQTIPGLNTIARTITDEARCRLRRISRMLKTGTTD